MPLNPGAEALQFYRAGLDEQTVDGFHGSDRLAHNTCPRCPPPRTLWASCCALAPRTCSKRPPVEPGCEAV